jgi:hypothetical protein
MATLVVKYIEKLAKNATVLKTTGFSCTCWIQKSLKFILLSLFLMKNIFLVTLGKKLWTKILTKNKQFF